MMSGHREMTETKINDHVGKQKKKGHSLFNIQASLTQSYTAHLQQIPWRYWAVEKLLKVYHHKQRVGSEFTERKSLPVKVYMCFFLFFKCWFISLLMSFFFLFFLFVFCFGWSHMTKGEKCLEFNKNRNPSSFNLKVVSMNWS